MRGKGFVEVAAPDRVRKLGFLCLHWVLTFNKKYYELSQNKVKNEKRHYLTFQMHPLLAIVVFLERLKVVGPDSVLELKFHRGRIQS